MSNFSQRDLVCLKTGQKEVALLLEGRFVWDLAKLIDCQPDWMSDYLLRKRLYSQLCQTSELSLGQTLAQTGAELRSQTSGHSWSRVWSEEISFQDC